MSASVTAYTLNDITMSQIISLAYVPLWDNVNGKHYGCYVGALYSKTFPNNPQDNNNAYYNR